MSKWNLAFCVLLAGCGHDVAGPLGDSGPPPDDLVGLPSHDLMGNIDLVGLCPTPMSAPGYVLEASPVLGVTVCRKDDPGGTPSYVTVADLTKVEIHSVSGAVVTPRAGKGPFGGPDPTVTRLGIVQLQDAANLLWPAKVLQIFDAQFYNPANNPTQLAFGVKQEGVVFSDGAASAQEFVGQKKALLISNVTHAVQIASFQEADLMQATASWADIGSNGRIDTAIIGLDAAANKGPGNSVARTFVGSDGVRLYVFISLHSTQVNADMTLRSFGATDTMMLCGGSSTQSMLLGNALFNTGELIPNALAIVLR